MINELKLTDDELSVVQTSLQFSIMTYKKHLEMYGDSKLDEATKEAIKATEDLFNKLNDRYF